MTSTKDVHDMLGITAGAGAPKQPPKKKGKAISKRPDGMAREVFSLLGERAPPIPIAEPAQYKAKRRVAQTDNVRWLQQPFVVTTRDDGLLLRHWRKEIEEPTGTPGGEESAQVEAVATADGDDDLPQSVLTSREKTMARLERNMKERATKLEPPRAEGYKFEKYKISVDVPKYDDSLYDAQLKSADWTREETDYLINLYHEWHGKWPLVVDRWDYKPANDDADDKKNGDVGSQIFRDRTMEDMKARFFEVYAKVIAAATPVEKMSATEFANREKMVKFEPKQEMERKRQKEMQLIRSKSERDEEKYLLAELERIYKRQEQFEAEVKDLRQRLDHSLTDDVPNAQLYQSSQEITGLFQKFLNRDKTHRQNRERQRSLYETGAASSPTTANNQNATASAGGNQASATKKGSAASHAQANRKALSARDEARFGVTTHERLTSGVTFKSDRIAKARQAKSQSKTEKIATILAELGVPEILQMPTNAVCTQMEKLVGKVNSLIDQRRVIEKEENELRIAREHRAMNDAQQSQNNPDGTAAQATSEQPSSAVDDAPDDQDEDTEMKDETEVNGDEEQADEEDDEGEAEEEEDQGEEEEAEIEEDEENVGGDADGEVDVDADEDEEEDGGEDEGEEDEETNNLDMDDDDANGDDEADANAEESNLEADIEAEDEAEEPEELLEDDVEEDGEEGEEEEEEEEEEEGEEEEEEEAEAEPEVEPEPLPPPKELTPSVPSTRGSAIRSHKRSASVMSASSAGSQATRAPSKRLKSARE